MIYLLAYLTVAGLMAMIAVAFGAFQRRDELWKDALTCVLWPASVALVAYVHLREAARRRAR